MNQEQELLPNIKEIILTLDVNGISDKRKAVLIPLINYLKDKISNNQPIALNFICTHNSRRSHLSQVWTQTLAFHLGIKNIGCYSGGTEATAMFPVAVETLKNMGFDIHKLSQTENPVYSIKYANNIHPVIGFSKTFDDTFNPKSNFGAIMTCSSADKGCPIVVGSDGRFPITYEDPKAFDNTPQQLEKYRERSIQIATEMLYVIQNAML